MSTRQRYPIIYVRGYAMTKSEITETTSTPYMGLEYGSTKSRQAWNGAVRKVFFESPIVRLMKLGYKDIYQDGLQLETGRIAPESIVIHRYYDVADPDFGTGKVPTVEQAAKGLSDLILRVRDQVCRDGQMKPEDFRVYLVAHSMGGLVCRCFLQNEAVGSPEARKLVDKAFTYATPHNGIEMAGMNVPGFFELWDMDNFNRDRMREYLAIKDKKAPANSLDGKFDPARFFCLVGTNSKDYAVAKGASRLLAGELSDGLVRISNAYVDGAPRAHVHRSHSGPYGIVNSEEGFQNLTRFLFGDIRVDIWVDIESVQLPPEIQGKPVNALYQFELLASPRGKRWYLTRRMAEEDSVACRSHQELIDPANKSARSLYLSSVFLAKHARVNPEHPSLAYSLTLGVRVPDYEVERKFWPDAHFEGGYLFRDALVVEIVPPQQSGESWTALFDWQSDQIGRASRPLAPQTLKTGKLIMSIPFGSTRSPGIAGQLRFVVSAWNG